MAVKEDRNVPPAKKLAGQAGESSTPARGLKILVVDDNADAASGLGRLLALLGHEVRVSRDGPAALLEIPEFHPRVVLLDLGMPGMDGLETAAKMRELPHGRDITYVAVTGWGQDRDRQRTESAGFAAHLTKPVNMQQLETVLARIATPA